MHNNIQRSKKNFRTVDLAYIAMGTVLITVCSWISVPLLVPFTMQTFAVFFVVSLLGGKRGLLSVLVYIALGAVGVPVFAEFTSGIGILLGTTGGYIVGFILIALIYWLFAALLGNRLWLKFLSLTIGMAVCYAFGTAWFMVVYARANEAIGLAVALSWCVVPFIIPDLAKLVLAVLLARRLSPALKQKG